MIVSSNSTDKTDGRPGLYSALSLLHNWLQDGHYQPEAAPDFEPLPAAEPAGPETDRSAAALAGGSSGLRSAAQRLPGNDSLEQVHQEIQRCLKCRLAGSRNRTVPGQGAARPLVLVIGEAPDAEDNNSGQAFSGAAGVLLDRMLAAIQLSRSSNCYLLHVVKCYPPAGRDPAPDEQTCCAEYLKRQIALLQPQAILALGRIPAQLLLSTKEGLQKLRGRVYDLDGRPCIISHSIANLLRDESLKRPAWEDLKLLRQVLPNA